MTINPDDTLFPIIAIDGISGAGKSSTAKRVAKELGFCHIDTGAMYRMVTFSALRAGLRPDQHAELGALARQLSFAFAPDQTLTVNGLPLPPDIR